jgi:threonine synthase
VVLPVSSGGHASGLWKGLREVHAAGLIAEMPRLYFVQAAAVSPIADAYERGDEAVEAVERAETVAYSIGNADPPSGARALRAVRETDGAVLAVDDEAILDAKGAIAERGGLNVESSCATTLAGARELAERGAFGPDEDVVLVQTGTGFTERAVDDVRVEPPTVAMADLDAAMDERLETGREI